MTLGHQIPPWGSSGPVDGVGDLIPSFRMWATNPKFDMADDRMFFFTALRIQDPQPVHVLGLESKQPAMDH